MANLTKSNPLLAELLLSIIVPVASSTGIGVLTVVLSPANGLFGFLVFGAGSYALQTTGLIALTLVRGKQVSGLRLVFQALIYILLVDLGALHLMGVIAGHDSDMPTALPDWLSAWRVYLPLTFACLVTFVMYHRIGKVLGCRA